MSVASSLAAGLAYFALGGLWFTPLFGRPWDRAVGFNRPSRWRPGWPYYLVPLIGCLVVAATVGLLMDRASAGSLGSALALGLVVGAGVSLPITSVNAVAPNMPRPALYAAVTGSYHVTGATLSAAVQFWLQG